MACQGCINRQKSLVKLFCKKPDSVLCRKARQRLEKMQQPEVKK